MLRIVEIKPVLNGWIVTVGCQRVVFNNLDDMLGEIGAYLEDPKASEEHYREHAVNSKHFSFDVAVDYAGTSDNAVDLNV